MYRRVEMVLLPARLLCLTFHLIAVIQVFCDVKYVVTNASGIQPNVMSDPRTITTFNRDVRHVNGVSAGAIGCFGIEYVTLFLGVTFFRHGALLSNAVLHFLGAIFVFIFYFNVWRLGWYYFFFGVFNGLPALVELLYFALFRWKAYRI